jgi:hypothetical protein
MNWQRMGIHSNHRHLGVAAAAALLLNFASAAHALDAIVLEVRELTVGGIPVSGASVRLDLLSDKQTRLTVTARAATLPDPMGKISDFSLVCERPVIAEPRYGCDAGRLTGRGGPSGALDMAVVAQMRTDTGITTFSGKGLKVMGTTATLDGRMDSNSWQVKGTTGTASVAALRKFAAPWFQLPAEITGDGKVSLDGNISESHAGMFADVTAKLDGVDLTNEASTIVTEEFAGTARFRARLDEADTTGIEMWISGNRGLVLINPVLFDFGKNPLDLEARGTFHQQLLAIESLHMTQAEALDMSGSGSVNLAGDTPLVSGHFKLAKVEFPAAYTSYMKTILALSVLGDATTAGSLSGELDVADNSVTALHVLPRNIELHADKGLLNLNGVSGDVYWSPAGNADARISKLEWASGGAYGLSGGAASLEFVAYGSNFALTHPAKLPVFDGAIAIDNFAMGNIGADNMEVSFKGAVEPISMPLLAKGFGWPQFSGTLAASVPSVTLKNNVLTFNGNLESQVFGGRITGSNIRLQDPLGNFPQFFADVRARDLDLALVTQTFEVGSITGKLDADVLGLELFGWSPQAFDARLATPKGDKSRHRISAKAVSSLSNVGGGGGGVVQALQSGVLKFFDEYNYEKLGITCKLRGNVCEMSGVEPAPNGYYIVKGAGIPRIDIVGNAGRVNWNQLISSIPKDFSGATVK